jgi:hypothetical protein
MTFGPDNTVINWNNIEIKNSCQLFSKCNFITTDVLKDFNFSKDTNMRGEFFNECNFNNNDIDISQWDLNNVTNFGRFFQYCKNINKIDFSNCNINYDNAYFSYFFYRSHINTVIFNNQGSYDFDPSYLFDQAYIKNIYFTNMKCKNFPIYYCDRYSNENINLIDIENSIANQNNEHYNLFEYIQNVNTINVSKLNDPPKMVHRSTVLSKNKC